MLRYARYAAAVFFALLAIGFVALWVRSYWRQDEVTFPRINGIVFILHSNQSQVCAMTLPQERLPPETARWRYVSSKALEESAQYRAWLYKDGYRGAFGFEFMQYFLPPGVITLLYVPHWFLAASSLGLAALLAFKRTWRFSIRGLLVATTLLAAILGLAVYAT